MRLWQPRDPAARPSDADDGGACFAGHDHGDADLLVGAHGMATALQSRVADAHVGEHQGMHRRVLGRGSDVSVHGQGSQERVELRFGGEGVLARPYAVATDEPDDPIHRGALGVHGVVVETEHLSDCLEECWWLTARRVRYTRSPSWRPELADNGRWAKLPKNPTTIALSRQNGT